MRVEEWADGQLVRAYDDGQPGLATAPDLVTLRAEVAKATTVAGLRSAVLGVVDAMGDSPA